MAFLAPKGLLTPVGDKRKATGAVRVRVAALAALTLVVAVTYATGPGVASARALPIERVKAAFIYKFANFVEWPPSAFESKDSPLVIGAVADDHFVDILKDVVDGKSVNARSIEVKKIGALSDLKGCQIAFISDTKHDELDRILSDIQDETILSIGDSDDFVDKGGIIKLYEEKNRLRFEINLDSAKRAQLKISSKLLDLATAVKGNASLESE